MSSVHQPAPSAGPTADPSTPRSQTRIEPPSAQLPPLERLRRIVHLLRAPGGCPWDREQDHRSIAPLLLEEAYETVEAIESGDHEHMREELGDLLLHVVMHGEIGSEIGVFDFDSIAAIVVEKMIRRHPHVFGSAEAGDSGAVLRQWDDIKREEKRSGDADKGSNQPERPFLHGVSHGLPALIRAHKLQKRVAKVGFEFASVADAMAKVHEELAEVEQALDDHQSLSEDAQPTSVEAGQEAVRSELGDLLFSVVNVSRLLGEDAETLLAAANRKFEQRFGAMESALTEAGDDLRNADLATMEQAWQAAKHRSANADAAVESNQPSQVQTANQSG